jgi:predicted Mrr-cat superfamily restriction endonuclease
MDLSTLKAANTVAEIRHPVTGEPIGLSITLRPATHPEVKAVQNRLTNEVLRQRQKMTSEKLDSNNLDRLVASTDAFTWGVGADGEKASFGGEQLEATPVNVRRLYREAPWIKQQVDEALGDEGRFYAGPDRIPV